MFIQYVPEKNSELSPLGYSIHPWESGPGAGVTISPTLPGPVLLWKQQNYLRLHSVNLEICLVLLGLLPRHASQRKSEHQNK